MEILSSLRALGAGFLLMLAIMPAVRAQKPRKSSPSARIQLIENQAAHRVDVTIDGQPFTSYLYPETLQKPVLYPLRAASGTIVTRGFPLQPRPSERVDHPHHVGLWFNYGDVNGLDFWNNSDSIKPEQRDKYGTIRHRRVNTLMSGNKRGVLEVTADWLTPAGKPLLREHTRYVFRGQGNARTIDRITTLTALDVAVAFPDNKEGLLGLRVARSLEQPSNQPEIFTDANGKATSVPVLNNEGVTGLYRSSEGLTGDKVWGTRAKWVALSGKVDTRPITLAIFDHPQNTGYPAYWHARGYGLFAANSLGQKAMSGGKETLNFMLPAGKSVTFRHRVAIYSSSQPEDQALEAEAKKFVAEK